MPLTLSTDGLVQTDLDRRIRSCLGAEEMDRIEHAPTREASEERACTRLMEQFRRTRSEAAFGLLFELAGPSMLRRIRRRLHRYGSNIDESDVLQEVFLNVYRYPDRFRSEREAAFRAWSGAIVENSIRRLARKLRSHGTEVSNELLELTPASPGLDPMRVAASEEDGDALERTLLILMAAYLQVHATLSTREQFVLQLVEVEGLRYKDAAALAGVRPEALKMVVFRARKRIVARLMALLCCEEPEVARN
jgi:RNA polymerase sigma factor (sigma-70 family)